jgi:hypothetical protein
MNVNVTTSSHLLLLEFHARTNGLLSTLQATGTPPTVESDSEFEAGVCSVVSAGRRLLDNLDHEKAARLKHFLLRITQETISVRNGNSAPHRPSAEPKGDFPSKEALEAQHERHPFAAHAVDEQWASVLVLAGQITVIASEMLEDSQSQALALPQRTPGRLQSMIGPDAYGAEQNYLDEDELNNLASLVTLTDFIGKPEVQAGLRSHDSISRASVRSSVSGIGTPRKLRLSSTRSWSVSAFHNSDEASLRVLCSLESSRTFLSGVRALLSRMVQMSHLDILKHSFASWLPADDLPELKNDPFLPHASGGQPQPKNSKIHEQMSNASLLSIQEDQNTGANGGMGSTNSLPDWRRSQGNMDQVMLTGKTAFSGFVKRFVALFGRQMIGVTSAPPPPAVVITSVVPSPAASPGAFSQAGASPGAFSPAAAASPGAFSPVASASPGAFSPPASSLGSSFPVSPAAASGTGAINAYPSGAPSPQPSGSNHRFGGPVSPATQALFPGSHSPSAGAYQAASGPTSTNQTFPPGNMWPELLRWRTRRFLAAGRVFLSLCLDNTAAAAQIRSAAGGAISMEQVPVHVRALIQLVHVLAALSACVETLGDATFAGNEEYPPEIQMAVNSILTVRSLNLAKFPLPF